MVSDWVCGEIGRKKRQNTPSSFNLADYVVTNSILLRYKTQKEHISMGVVAGIRNLGEKKGGN